MPDLVTQTNGEWSLNVTLNGSYSVEDGLQFTPEMAVVEGGGGIEIVLQASSEVWRAWLRSRLKNAMKMLGDSGIITDDDSNAILDSMVAEALSDTGWTLDKMNPGGFKLALSVTVWRWVLDHLAFDVDFSADGGAYKSSQMQVMALQRLRESEDRARAAGLPGYVWAETDGMEISLA